jgi:hypothetical protein
MATLEIIIKGIALIEMKHEWNVYLPFDDDCHRVTLTVPGHPAMDLADAGQRISVSVNNPSTPAPRPIPMPDSSFPTFFDIAHPKAHVNGVYLRRNWADKTVLLSVPGGNYSARRSSTDYKLVGPDNAETHLGRIGSEGRIILQGEEIILDTLGSAPMTFARDTVITIDNDCYRQEIEEKNNDFHMLYESVIRDRIEPERYFRVTPTSMSGELPCNNFRTSQPLLVEP